MINTKFNSALCCARHFTCDLTVTDAVKLYQENPSDELYAFIYKKVYKLAINLKKSYSLLTWQEVESISMEELHKAIQDFNEKKETKFTTFYVTYLKRAFYREHQRLVYDIRKVNTIASSYEKLLEDTNFDIEYESDEVEIFELIESLPKTLNQKERVYCILKIKHVNISDTDIAEILKVSSANISYIKSRLQKKLENF